MTVTAPRVFLDYDQQALDDAYDQSVYAANREQILARLATNSALVRERLGEPRRFAYGPAAIEGLDVFVAPCRNAPINVFIHGGAWRAGAARNYAFPAELFRDAGAHFVVLDFNSVEEVDGDLAVLADQVRRAVAWVHRNAARFDGDATRLYVSGSSSGAHLGGVVATTDWEGAFSLPRDTVKGYTLASGMYDLRGPRLSKRSRYVRFTDAIEEALSPQRHLGRIVAPITLLYGTLESPEFQRQTRDFAAALRDAGKPVKLVVAEGYNHFEIGETIASPYGAFGRAVLDDMQLPPSANARRPI
jgi:arylformamidase